MNRALRFAIPVICIIFFSTAAVKAQVPSNQKSPMLKRADSLYFAKDWPNARVLYKQILGDTSHNAIAWNRLGFAEYNTGHYAAAMKCYEKSLKNSPVPPLKASVYSRMARINAMQNKNDAAYANIDSAVASGFVTFPELDTLRDFDKIRSTDKFKQLRTKAYNTAYPCMGSSHAREFDFWVGEWNAFTTGTTVYAGHSVIQVIAGGCAILENWTSNNGFNNGKSINFIDPVTNKWKQSWAGAYTGGIQEFVNGEYKDGALRFTFETIGPQNQKLIGRFIFYNQPDGKVRQFNETSADNGKTWTTSYDFTYVKVKDSKADL